MMDFWNEYFVQPLYNHEGYNPVNTSVYALIALLSAYLIYRLFVKKGIAFDKTFISSVIPFILFGASTRVITDSIDTLRMQAYRGFMEPIYTLILNTHLWDYGPLTASPGIYIWVGLFTAVGLYWGYTKGKLKEVRRLVYALFMFNLIILLPMSIHYDFALSIIGLASLITYVYYQFKPKSSVPMHWMVVFAQALDGSATFITLDVFNSLANGTYYEQHVFANYLASLFGGSMLVFLIVKVLLAVLVVHVLEKEGDREKGFISLLAIIFGLAPGLRDLLRLLINS